MQGVSLMGSHPGFGPAGSTPFPSSFGPPPGLKPSSDPLSAIMGAPGFGAAPFIANPMMQPPNAA